MLSVSWREATALPALSLVPPVTPCAWTWTPKFSQFFLRTQPFCFQPPAGRLPRSLVGPMECPHGTQLLSSLLLPALSFPACLHAAQAWNPGSFLASLLLCVSRYHQALFPSFKIFLVFLFALLSSQFRAPCASWISVSGFPSGLPFYSLSPMQDSHIKDFCHISFPETWLSFCPFSVWPSTTLCCPWDRIWTLILAFKATYSLLLGLFIPWWTWSSLSLPSDHTRGFPASSPVLTSYPSQGGPHLASSGEHHLFSRAGLQCYLLSETLATSSHSDISLLSSPVGSLRTCLPKWTSTPEDIVDPSHLRLLTMLGLCVL